MVLRALAAALLLAAALSSALPACVSSRLCEFTAAAAPSGDATAPGPRAGGPAQFESRALLRSFYNVSRPPHKAKVSGRLTTLMSPAAHHFAVLPPLLGCGAGAGAPVSSLAAAFAARRHFAWRGAFLTSAVHGCRVAANGGLFDTRTFACHGALVATAAARVHAVSGARGAVFGVAADGGGAVAGYLDDADVAALRAAAAGDGAAAARLRAFLTGGGGGGGDISSLRAEWRAAAPAAAPPPPAGLASLVPGLVVLLRDGASAVGSLADVASGASAPLRDEDMRVQESGSAVYFASAASGRAAIGVDGAGRLALAAVDGRTDWLGLDLATFASWLRRAAGLRHAINLDGGASVTLLHDGRPGNVPSYACTEPGAVGAWGLPGGRDGSGARAPQRRGGDDPDFKCARPVSSAVCIHDDPVAPAPANWAAEADAAAAGGGGGAAPLAVPSGCVCFAEGDGDDAFSIQEVRAMVAMGAGAGAAGASAAGGRRLSWHSDILGEAPPPPTRRAAAAAAALPSLPLPEPLYSASARAAAAAAAAAVGATLAGNEPTCLCTGDATAGAAAGAAAPPHALWTLHRLPFRERLFRWHAAIRALPAAAALGAGAGAGDGPALPVWPVYAGEIDEDESGAGEGGAAAAAPSELRGGRGGSTTVAPAAAVIVVAAAAACVGSGLCSGAARRCRRRRASAGGK
jgi:hypothetical protein